MDDSFPLISSQPKEFVFSARLEIKSFQLAFRILRKIA